MRFGDCLALLLPPLALALTLLLPLPWKFDVIIFCFFVALLVVLLGFGFFKKWYSRSWFFLWLGAAAFYAFFFMSGRSAPMPSFFSDAFSYVQYDDNCHGPCYVPLSPVGSAGIALFFGLLVLVARRGFPRIFYHILFAALSFWVFYLVIVTPVYGILAEFNLRILHPPSQMTAPWIIPLALVLLAMFLAVAAGCVGRKRFFPFFALFALLFLFANAATLQYMKHHIGYSIRWMRMYEGNGENLLALFRNYTDMLWVRPAFYTGLLLLGILLFLFFLRAGKRIASWQRKLKENGRSGSWAIHALSFPKFVGWLVSPLILVYIVVGLMLHRLSLNRIDEAFFENILIMGKAKENLLSFLLFIAIVVIAGVISWLRGRHSRPSPAPAPFSLAWLRNHALEIASILAIALVLVITCAGFKVGARDWQKFRSAQKAAASVEHQYRE